MKSPTNLKELRQRTAERKADMYDLKEVLAAEQELRETIMENREQWDSFVAHSFEKQFKFEQESN